MAAIIQLRIPASSATLGETVTSVPEVSMEVEQFAGSTGGSKRPLIWVRSERLDDVDRALDADSAVAEYAVVSEADDRRLYELGWADPADTTFRALEEHGGHLRRAGLDDGEWSVELLFPRREQLSRMYEAQADRGLAMTIDSICELGDDDSVNGLTEGQRGTIEAALASGYYDVPRETSLTGLSEELEVSHQALSERLRRAHKCLVTAALRGHATDRSEGDHEPPHP